MNRDLDVYLRDILESLNLIEEYVKSIDEEEFYSSIQLQDSVIRRFEVIGEAAKQIPDRFRKKYSHIPWREMAGLRDVLIHHYFGVSIDRIWKMIKNDLPKIAEDISKLLSYYKTHKDFHRDDGGVRPKSCVHPSLSDSLPETTEEP